VRAAWRFGRLAPVGGEQGEGEGGGGVGEAQRLGDLVGVEHGGFVLAKAFGWALGRLCPATVAAAAAPPSPLAGPAVVAGAAGLRPTTAA